MGIPDVTTIAGCGIEGYVDGKVSKARFSNPGGISVDAFGNIWILDNNCIRKISVNGIVSTVAGDGTAGFKDGPGANARFNFSISFGPAFDWEGNLIIADGFNNRIRKVAIDGTVSTVAGTGERGYLDGPAHSAQFEGLSGVVVDGDGNIIVSEYFNCCIRKITREGTVSTLAGINEPGFVDGKGSLARFEGPLGVAVDRSGNILVCDSHNASIRKITPSGEVTTLMSNGIAEDEDRRSEVCLDDPSGVVVDGDDNVIVTDKGNDRVVKINSEGILSEIYREDKESTNRKLHGTSGDVAIDGEGNVLMFDDTSRYLFSIAAKLSPPPKYPSVPHGEVNAAHLLSLHKSRSKYCDIDVHVDDRVFPAHRIMLAQSPFFEACFTEEFCESTEKKVVLKEVAPAAFELVLDYLYTENWTFPSDCDVLTLRSAAEFLMLPQLQQRCETEIQKRLCSDNLVRCLRYAKSNSVNGLKRQCIEFASSSAAELARVFMTKDCTAMFQEDAELSKEFLEECEANGG